MRFFNKKAENASLTFDDANSSAADKYAWEQYQNGYASNYTKAVIAKLNCSDAMKQKIEADIRDHRAGGELHQEPSRYTYAFDGLYYDNVRCCYTNDVPKSVR